MNKVIRLMLSEMFLLKLTQVIQNTNHHKKYGNILKIKQKTVTEDKDIP